jgi:hypothetical protein
MIWLEFHIAQDSSDAPPRSLFAPQQAMRIRLHVRPPVSELTVTGTVSRADISGGSPITLSDVNKTGSMYIADYTPSAAGVYHVTVTAQKASYRPTTVGGTFYCQ